METQGNTQAGSPAQTQNTIASFLREWGGKISIVVIAVLWLLLVASTWANAQEASDAEGPAPSGDEYSFNWLDPEKRISVLQNRRYRKANHLMFTAQGGLGISNPYRNEYTYGPRLTYYFTEAWGVEFFYNWSSNSNNSTYTAFQESVSGTTSPTVRDIKSKYGGLLTWAPWYAKINVFNQILYFDWYFAGGAGNMATAFSRANSSATGPATITGTQSLFALYFGTGHLYHLNENWLVRLDLLGSYYNAKSQGDIGKSTWYSNYSFSVGVGLSL